jgi:hypothetical protein
MKMLAGITLIAAAMLGQQESQPSEPRLKTRDEVAAPTARPPLKIENGMWIVPAGTKIPIQLRQPVSTKGAKPGDPIYAQTTFPVALGGNIVIPAGTWVQGVVDHVKRAGRVKGKAELQFHLTTLIYSNGYTVDLAAAIDQVPGSENLHMKEPGTVEHDSQKGKDLEKVGTAASQGAQIGALGGMATGAGSNNPGSYVRRIGIGGLSGAAAGTLIALLARGADVRFETGTAVEISLGQAMALDPDKATRNGAGTL